MADDSNDTQIEHLLAYARQLRQHIELATTDEERLRLTQEWDQTLAAAEALVAGKTTAQTS